MPWLFKNPNHVLSVQGNHVVIMKVVIMKEMPWLFKDPIVTVAWLNFDHVQSNSKKMVYNYQIAPNEIFSWYTTNKIFMYLLDPFILQNFKKFLEPIQSYEDVPFSGPKWLTCPEQLFFLYKPLLLLSSIYSPFSLCKI